MDAFAGEVARIRAEAETLRSWGADSRADAAERTADRLEAAFREWQAEALTVAAAAAESGYSESHLRALLAEGKLANIGREGAPRIRRADLPAKPKAGTGPALSLADEALERRRA